jgi:hypothetical protein
MIYPILISDIHPELHDEEIPGLRKVCRKISDGIGSFLNL